MAAQGVRIRQAVAPDLAFDLLAGDHARRFAHQDGQQAQADRRQLQLGTGTGGTHADRIEHQVGDLEHFRPHLATFAADQRAQAGFQLLDRERLGQVVIGAETEAGELVVQRVACREHQHRGGLARIVAQATAHFDAIQARQHQVEHHDVIAVFRRKAVAIQAVLCIVDFKAATFQVFPDHLGDVAVVFDHQHQAGGLLRLTHVIPSNFSFVKHAGSTVDAM